MQWGDSPRATTDHDSIRQSKATGRSGLHVVGANCPRVDVSTMLTRTNRRTIVFATAAALAGCSGIGGSPSPTTTGTPADNPAVGEVPQRGDLQLTSPAFDAGGTIPQEYGRDARDVNPPLAIAGVPADAASLVLIMDDPDALEPAGRVWLHWLVWNIPPSGRSIPEAWSPAAAVVGTNDFGEPGYGGPAPPDGPHRYRFKLYALDTTLDLPRSATKLAVGRGMAGARIAQTQLSGTYVP